MAITPILVFNRTIKLTLAVVILNNRLTGAKATMIKAVIVKPDNNAIVICFILISFLLNILKTKNIGKEMYNKLNTIKGIFIALISI